MSIAKAEEDSGRGGSGGSGQTSEGVGGGAGDAGQDGQGEGGQSDENEDDEEPEVLIPELESREFERAQEDPVDPPEHTEAAKEGEGSVPPDLATIEGILRALEEVDMAEQMSTRGRRFDVVIKGDWW